MERGRSRSVQTLEIGLVEPVVSAEDASRTRLVSELCGVSPPLWGSSSTEETTEGTHLCALGGGRKYVRLIER